MSSRLQAKKDNAADLATPKAPGGKGRKSRGKNKKKTQGKTGARSVLPFIQLSGGAFLQPVDVEDYTVSLHHFESKIIMN